MEKCATTSCTETRKILRRFFLHHIGKHENDVVVSDLKEEPFPSMNLPVAFAGTGTGAIGGVMSTGAPAGLPHFFKPESKFNKEAYIIGAQMGKVFGEKLALSAHRRKPENREYRSAKKHLMKMYAASSDGTLINDDAWRKIGVY